MKIDIPDTRYDYTHPWWNNAQDRVAWERSFSGGTYEERSIAQAMITQNPSTPNAEIAAKMIMTAVPSRFGYNDTELTITDVLDQDFKAPHVDDMKATDFSGKTSGYEGTSIPCLPAW